LVIKKLIKRSKLVKRSSETSRTTRFGGKKITLEKERKFESCKRQVRKRNKKLPPNKRVNPFAVCRSALQI
jgi:hypothetical protein